MNGKQFDRFQSALQWVADEERAVEAAERSSLVHTQETWVFGRVGKPYTGPLSQTVNEECSPEWARQILDKQFSEVCATNCCFAGNVVIANGDTIIASGFIEGDLASPAMCVDADGNVHTIAKRATDLLGITPTQARDMFDGNNEPAMLYQRGARIAEAYGHELRVI